MSKASSFSPPRNTGSRPEISGIATSDKGSSESGAAPATYALPGWFLKIRTAPAGSRFDNGRMAREWRAREKMKYHLQHFTTRPLIASTSPLGETTNLRLAGIANGPGTFLRSIIWE